MVERLQLFPPSCSISWSLVSGVWFFLGLLYYSFFGYLELGLAF